MADKKRTRESRAAIERLYITMRHLFIRGSYKPLGVSGKSLIDALLVLNPEIYGAMSDGERVELDGLLYVMERLPDGIEECRMIKLIAREGFENAGYERIVPIKRRRNCYRVDKDRMYIEMTRGRSDIYDILTHLTFLFIEANKIKNHCINPKGDVQEDWYRLEKVVEAESGGEDMDELRAAVYLSNIIGRTLEETKVAIEKFQKSNVGNSLYHIVYHLGRVAIAEEKHNHDKQISFSRELRDIVGQHAYGEKWSDQIKSYIYSQGWIGRPIHVISANMHSVMNTLYGFEALKEENPFVSLKDLAFATSQPDNGDLRNQISEFALVHGMHEIKDTSGTNLTVQIIDVGQLQAKWLPSDLGIKTIPNKPPVLIVMDYAFGEQAYECLDELLKPYERDDQLFPLNVESVSVMGKAGILEGEKGDIMIPTAHVFEGTADNYPINNQLAAADFQVDDLKVFEGTMITVLGTSLQNHDILTHFLTSTWNAVGLEMEGAHYQKAIQSAAKIRLSIREDVDLYYAYYASDNPLKSGSTLASGSLGVEGILPTYLITEKILQKILQ
ncbi:MAG: hypothetical protein AAGA85_21210 [Bacteroidota bacterium]